MNANFLGCRVVYEFKIDVAFMARKHFIVSRRFFIEGEDDTNLRLHSENNFAPITLKNNDSMLLREEDCDKLGDLVRAAIKNGFNQEKFTFKIYIATKKTIKEYRYGNYIMAVTKCEVQKIRNQSKNN